MNDLNKNNTKKIFLVTSHGSYEYEESQEYYAFNDKEEAIAKKEELKEKAMKLLNTDRFTYITEESELAFYVHRDGEYILDHITIEVLELEIKERIERN